MKKFSLMAVIFSIILLVCLLANCGQKWPTEPASTTEKSDFSDLPRGPVEGVDVGWVENEGGGLPKGNGIGDKYLVTNAFMRDSIYTEKDFGIKNFVAKPIGSFKTVLNRLHEFATYVETADGKQYDHYQQLRINGQALNGVILLEGVGWFYVGSPMLGGTLKQAPIGGEVLNYSDLKDINVVVDGNFVLDNQVYISGTYNNNQPIRVSRQSNKFTLKRPTSGKPFKSVPDPSKKQYLSVYSDKDGSILYGVTINGIELHHIEDNGVGGYNFVFYMKADGSITNAGPDNRVGAATLEIELYSSTVPSNHQVALYHKNDGGQEHLMNYIGQWEGNEIWRYKIDGVGGEFLFRIVDKTNDNFPAYYRVFARIKNGDNIVHQIQCHHVVLDGGDVYFQIKIFPSLITQGDDNLQGTVGSGG